MTTIDTVDAGDLPSLYHADHDVPPGAAVGRYIVLHALGEGGNGVVYAAYDPKLDRKVALKLVRPTARNHARLLREAQALARLSHPNVVAVHDVGSFGDRVFVAMELVEGVTLRAWLRKEPRSVKDVLRVYLAAADGLVAAHERGLIHRDFKPDNVLVGNDGLVRVVDFGLAMKSDTRDEDIPPTPEPATTDRLALHLTQVGAIMGTPGYMAPEQYLRTGSDVRTDQFAFCAALYEGLYGELPFRGSTFDELNAATCAGEVREPPRTRGVPSHVQRAILRGLSVDPAQRWDSLRALLVVLRHDHRAPLRRGAFALLVTCALGSIVALLVRGENRRAAVCSGSDALLAQHWNPKLEGAIGRAFAATGLPYAARAQSTVLVALDQFADSWVHARKEACLATHERGEQSEEVLSVRLSCLDEKLDEFHAFAQLMAGGGQNVVQRAVEASAHLPRVAECADVAALTSPIGVPSDPALREAVSRLRAELGEARASATAGEYTRAATALGELVPRATTLGFRPALAEVLLELGSVQVGLGEYEVAEQTLRRAEDLAEECRHDQVRGRSLIEQVEVTGRWLGHYADAESMARRAAAVARRLRRPELEWAALDASARVHGYLGRVSLAVDEGRKSLALARKLFGDDDLRVARAHGALSIALAEDSRLEEAVDEDRIALAISERALGATHPSLVRMLTNVATGLTWRGLPAEALPFAVRAEQLAARELGVEHPQHGLALNVIGYVQNALGAYAEGLAANERSLRIYELRGAEYVENVYPLVGVGEALLGLGEAARALPPLARALAIAEAHGLDAETMGACYFHYGRALSLARHERARADELVQKAVAEFARVPRLRAARERAEAWLAGGEPALVALTDHTP